MSADPSASSTPDRNGPTGPVQPMAEPTVAPAPSSHGSAAVAALRRGLQAMVQWLVGLWACAPRWRVLAVVLGSVGLSALVQVLHTAQPEATGAVALREAQILRDNAFSPPEALASAPKGRLPRLRPADQPGATWLAFELPPHSAGSDQLRHLALAYRPGVMVFLDGRLLARSGDETTGDQERLIIGMRRLSLDLPAPAGSDGAPQRLQLRLASPGPSGAMLEPPLVGPARAVEALDRTRQRWQMLRAATVLGALFVAGFLALVARIRRDEPLYALSALHLLLLAVLLSPYVLPEQPLPSPWWRVLLDVADLGAKLLLVAITARLAQAWRPWLRQTLLVIALVGLPIDITAAIHNWTWTGFAHHPWPWWALGVRSGLLGMAWWLSLRALRREPSAARTGTALLVGLSASTWAAVSFGVLVFRVPVLDANALAHAGWLLWVAILLQQHFTDAARRERELRERLAGELAARERELQAAFAAQAEAERERAAADQRRRLLQDLHDGLGARLLDVKLRAAQWSPTQLAEALDQCLVEMRLSVDSLTEDRGDLGVLLGGWRQRVEPMLRAAGLAFQWQVHAAPVLPGLRGGGGLELIRSLQEALANAIRHADATRVVVHTEEVDGQLVLSLIDDGVGLPGGEALPGQGCRSLGERARRLGGEVQWISPVPPGWRFPRPGTAVVWRLPLDETPARV